MRNIGIIILLVLCLTLLLLTGCMINTVTPEIDNGNLENQTVEEPAIEESATAKVDTTKPVITGSRAPLPNSFGWNNTDVTVSFSCIDVGPVQSGIETNTVAGKIVTTEGKGQSVTNTGECIDAAGNVADPVTVSNINIDKTPPVVTITLPKNGKYALNESVTATWSVTDNLSGVEDSKAPKTIKINTKSKGKKKITLPPGLVKDEAGNSSEEVTVTYEVVEGDSIEPDPVISDSEEPVIVDLEDPNTVSPQKWATGDGTVEDPWANDCIQKAYDFVPAGGTIFLKTGYYKLSATVTLAKKVNIVGEGIDKTFIVTTDSSGFLVTGDYCSLKDFTVDGDAQTNNGESTYCIRTYQADYLLLENIKVKNSGYYGMSVVSDYSTFRNIYAVDNYRHGIHPGAGHYNVYRNIHCWDNGVSGFDDSGGSNSSNNIYDNLYCWNNGTYGICLYNQSDGALTNSSAHNNGDYGINLKHGYNFTIENCFVHSNGYAGVNIINCDNVNLSNVISKNNATTVGNTCGVHIKDTPFTKLSSCQLYDDRDSPIQSYGIWTEGTTKYVELANCKLSPNRSSIIYNMAGAVITITETKLARFYQL